LNYVKHLKMILIEEIKHIKVTIRSRKLKKNRQLKSPKEKNPTKRQIIIHKTLKEKAKY
jgi:hypothetical protein